jgi:DNA-binding response OmpR family regulator
MSAALRILLVEDNSWARHALTGMLTRRGYVVATAESVAEATRRLREHEWDCVLVDLFLGDGNGADVLREARARGGNALRVLLLTGADLGTVDGDWSGPALQKPVTAEELVDAIEARGRWAP